MAWIKLDHTTADKPEVMQMADLLSISPEQAFGHLCRVWVWADQQSLDGHEVNVTEKGLDRIARHDGFATAMRGAGWITGKDGAISFPNFDRHNGETAKQRALAAKRKVTERSRNRRDIVVTREDKREIRKETKAGLPDWVPEDAWKAWLEVRGRVKAPNTVRALNIAIRDLEKLKAEGNDPREVLEAATLKGWRGLFPIKQVAPVVKIQAAKTCAYCDGTPLGTVNGYRYCRDDTHYQAAMSNVRPAKSA